MVDITAIDEAAGCAFRFLWPVRVDKTVFFERGPRLELANEFLPKTFLLDVDLKVTGLSAGLVTRDVDEVCAKISPITAGGRLAV